MLTDKEVIDSLLAIMGPTRVAEAIGAKGPQVVNNWKNRGVPGKWRFAIRSLANRRAKCELPMAWLDARKVS